MSSRDKAEPDSESEAAMSQAGKGQGIQSLVATPIGGPGAVSNHQS